MITIYHIQNDSFSGIQGDLNALMLSLSENLSYGVYPLVITTWKSDENVPYLVVAERGLLVFQEEFAFILSNYQNIQVTANERYEFVDYDEYQPTLMYELSRKRSKLIYQGVISSSIAELYDVFSIGEVSENALLWLESEINQLSEYVLSDISIVEMVKSHREDKIEIASEKIKRMLENGEMDSEIYDGPFHDAVFDSMNRNMENFIFGLDKSKE
jgi:hypothetical protein